MVILGGPAGHHRAASASAAIIGAGLRHHSANSRHQRLIQ
jgi:hypothetical protein